MNLQGNMTDYINDQFCDYIQHENLFERVLKDYPVPSNKESSILDGFIKVSECPFKQNRSMLKNMTVLLHTYFFNISLNVLKPTFFNIYNLPFLRPPNIGKIRVKVGPKINYFSYFMSSCTNRIAVFNNFFSLIYRQPRDKQNRARDFFLFKYFLNNQLLTVFMQNMLSRLVELLL